MDGSYQHGSPHVMSKICWKNPIFLPSPNTPTKISVLIKLSNETYCIKRWLILYYMKWISGMVDPSPGSFNNSIEAVIDILRILSTAMNEMNEAFNVGIVQGNGFTCSIMPWNPTGSEQAYQWRCQTSLPAIQWRTASLRESRGLFVCWYNAVTISHFSGCFETRLKTRRRGRG